jgi:hypothetical protein
MLPPGDIWVMECHGGMILTGGKRRTRIKPCSCAILSTTNPTLTEAGANPALRDKRQATNRLSHGVSYLVLNSVCMVLLKCSAWLDTFIFSDNVRVRVSKRYIPFVTWKVLILSVSPLYYIVLTQMPWSLRANSVCSDWMGGRTPRVSVLVLLAQRATCVCNACL